MTIPDVELPDVEALVVAFLKPVASPQKVSTLVPDPRPASFVRVFRTGGAATNRVLERAQITVQAWAKDTGAAVELAKACRTALLNRSTSMPLVRGVEETGGLYFDPDPGTGIPRYTFTVQITVRAKRV